MINKFPTSIMEINSGESLLIYLKESGLKIDHWSGIPGTQNCIYLPDKSSFNWKKADGIVRVNTKEHAKQMIEAHTGLEMQRNGTSDSVRDFSLLIHTEADLIKVIDALKLIEGNM